MATVLQKQTAGSNKVECLYRLGDNIKSLEVLCLDGLDTVSIEDQL